MTLLYLLFTNALFISIILGVGFYLLVAHWEKKAKKEQSKWPQMGKRIKVPREISDSLDDFEQGLRGDLEKIS